MHVDAWGSKAAGIFMDDGLTLRTDLKGLNMQMRELQTSFDADAARTEANIPKHVSFGKIECLECQQTDGHFRNHLLTTVKEGERCVRNTIIAIGCWLLVVGCNYQAIGILEVT